MGLYNFMIDMGQSAQISHLTEVCEELQKQIDEQKEQIEMLSKWVEYLKVTYERNPDPIPTIDNETLHRGLSAPEQVPVEQ